MKIRRRPLALLLAALLLAALATACSDETDPAPSPEPSLVSPDPTPTATPPEPTPTLTPTTPPTPIGPPPTLGPGFTLIETEGWTEALTAADMAAALAVAETYCQDRVAPVPPLIPAEESHQKYRALGETYGLGRFMVFVEAPVPTAFDGVYIALYRLSGQDWRVASFGRETYGLDGAALEGPGFAESMIPSDMAFAQNAAAIYSFRCLGAILPLRPAENTHEGYNYANAMADRGRVITFVDDTPGAAAPLAYIVCVNKNKTGAAQWEVWSTSLPTEPLKVRYWTLTPEDRAAAWAAAEAGLPPEEFGRLAQPLQVADDDDTFYGGGNTQGLPAVIFAAEHIFFGQNVWTTLLVLKHPAGWRLSSWSRAG
ncbi:MAG: hypothetical protein LBT60_00830 [Oscillospiraceae bacterium]|jgi:hypothetical protein|nr:hypothetical protein [Oscillospiraceae bacterium]